MSATSSGVSAPWRLVRDDKRKRRGAHISRKLPRCAKWRQSPPSSPLHRIRAFTQPPADQDRNPGAHQNTPLIKLGFPVEDMGRLRRRRPHPPSRCAKPPCAASLSRCAPTSVRPPRSSTHRGPPPEEAESSSCPAAPARRSSEIACMERISQHTPRPHDQHYRPAPVATRARRQKPRSPTRISASIVGEVKGHQAHHPHHLPDPHLQSAARTRTSSTWSLFNRTKLGDSSFTTRFICCPRLSSAQPPRSRARRRLGLTATLVREDNKEDEVFFAHRTPKRFDKPWKDLEKQGMDRQSPLHGNPHPHARGTTA